MIDQLEMADIFGWIEICWYLWAGPFFIWKMSWLGSGFEAPDVDTNPHGWYMATWEDGYWTLLSPPFQSQPRTMINSNTGNDRMMMMMMMMMLLLLLLLTGIMWVNVRVPPTMFGRTSKRLVSDLLAWTYVVLNQDVGKVWISSFHLAMDIPHLVRWFFPLKPLFLDDFSH